MLVLAPSVTFVTRDHPIPAENTRQKYNVCWFGIHRFTKYLHRFYWLANWSATLTLARFLTHKKASVLQSKNGEREVKRWKKKKSFKNSIDGWKRKPLFSNKVWDREWECSLTYEGIELKELKKKNPYGIYKMIDRQKPVNRYLTRKKKW